MIGTLIDILSWIALVAGAVFYVVGAIGIVRMPDVFTRVHAAGVSDTLGLGLLTIGMLLQAGLTLVAVKLLFIILIVWTTGAIATHALTRAALHDGVMPLLAGPGGRLSPTRVFDLFPELKVRIATPTSSETMDELPKELGRSDKEDTLRKRASALGIDGDDAAPAERAEAGTASTAKKGG